MAKTVSILPSAELLKQFNASLTHHLSVAYSEELRRNLDVWVQSNKPYVWEGVEQYEDYVLFLDHGYGLMYLVKADVPIEYGRYSITRDDVVCLDKVYYGITQYIWRPA